MKKLIIVIALVIAGVGGALFYNWCCERALDRADNEGYAAVQSFFKLIGTGNPDASQYPAITAEIGRMAEISTRCREDVRQLLLLRRMDGAFLLGDFAGAEKLMDEYTERSEAWRNGAKAKIRAHAAIVKGDHKQAVAELEAFVKMVLEEPEMESELDPSTDEEWTREMIVAKNYYRLALLASAYDAKAAADYTAKAKEFIEKAKQVAQGDKAMLATIEKIVKESDKP